jgi:glycosyltransferase involved in cell wall biosynthesis
MARFTIYRDRSHFFSIVLFVSSGAASGMGSGKAAREENADQLPKWRVPRSFTEICNRTLGAPSGYLVEVLRDFSISAQIVPNIVDLSQFHYRLRETLRPHLVCTRGFHPYYGIDVLVHAFAEVKKLYPEAQLDLVGGGQLERGIRVLVRELDLSGVNFPGVAARNEIGRVYDKADIFVNASNLDNMPVSVLEAFASGTPVVTTAPEGMRYIVEHEYTGLLSEPGDPSALANNIVRLLRDSELATKLAKNAFAESAKYRWDAVREGWLSVYDQLLPDCKRASAERPADA